MVADPLHQVPRRFLPGRRRASFHTLADDLDLDGLEEDVAHVLLAQLGRPRRMRLHRLRELEHEVADRVRRELGGHDHGRELCSRGVLVRSGVDGSEGSEEPLVVLALLCRSIAARLDLHAEERDRVQHVVVHTFAGATLAAALQVAFVSLGLKT